MSIFDFLTGQKQTTQNTTQNTTNASTQTQSQLQQGDQQNASASEQSGTTTSAQNTSNKQTGTNTTSQDTTQNQTQKQTGQQQTVGQQTTTALDPQVQALLTSILGNVGGNAINLNNITTGAASSVLPALQALVSTAANPQQNINDIVSNLTAAAQQSYQQNTLRDIETKNAFTGSDDSSFAQLSRQKGAQDLSSQIGGQVAQAILGQESINNQAATGALGGAATLGGIGTSLSQLLGSFGIPGVLKGAQTTTQNQQTTNTLQDLVSQLTGNTGTTSNTSTTGTQSQTGATSSDVVNTSISQLLSQLLTNTYGSSTQSSSTGSNTTQVQTPGILDFVNAFANLAKK